MRQGNFFEEDVALAEAPAPRQAGTVEGWNRVALQAIRAVQPGAPVAAHALAILHTCMYNAWAAYDDDARQTTHGVAVRLPRTERSAASKASAMSHAAFLALTRQFPSQQRTFEARMACLGLDPAPLTPASSQFTPAAIGRAQAASMLMFYNKHGAPFALPGTMHEPGARKDAGAGCHLPGRWWTLARCVSERDGYDDDRQVRLYFALANALSDAAVAVLDTRRADSAAAAAEVLRRFTGSALPAGGVVDAGRELGRKVGALAFDKARRYWEGKL